MVIKNLQIFYMNARLHEDNLLFWLKQTLIFICPEYCERYAKAEDIGRCPEEDSSDGEASEEEEYMSSDEEMAGHADL